MSVIAAAAVAAVAASLIGTASVAQRRGSMTVPTFAAGDPRLISALARSPWWWAGTGASLAGIGLQVLALALGPILLVQSVMTTSIVGATLAERILLKRRTATTARVGILLTVLGLAGLLVALAPRAGGGQGPSALTSVAVAAVAAAVMATFVVRARHPSRRPHARPLGLAFATGLGYGVSAVQLKQVGTQLADGIVTPLAHPALYVALVLGSLSILLSQHALREGVGVASVVSVILVVDPLVGLVAGGLWFGDTVTTSTSALAVAALSLCGLLVGMVATQSSPAGAPHGRDVAQVDSSQHPRMRGRSVRRRDQPPINPARMHPHIWGIGWSITQCVLSWRTKKPRMPSASAAGTMTIHRRGTSTSRSIIGPVPAAADVSHAQPAVVAATAGRTTSQIDSAGLDHAQVRSSPPEPAASRPVARTNGTSNPADTAPHRRTRLGVRIAPSSRCAPTRWTSSLPASRSTR